MSAQVYDDRRCELGEGPLWHPLRGQLFWFDILGQRLMWQERGAAREHGFAEICSAAGWVSETELLIASETRLFVLDLESFVRRDVCALEAGNPMTRSNDGRADPNGGFWIGTMGKGAEPGAGAIYRYYKGALRQIHGHITIPNALCFAPDGRRGYFADTVTGRIMTQALDAEGWPQDLPEDLPEVFVDLTAEGLNPDGAVTDAAGNLWCAQWGASRVACYGPDGAFRQAVDFPARHTSCPAFGGKDFDRLYCTTALEHLDEGVRAAEPMNGQTFAAPAPVRGRAEAQVLL